MVRFVRFVNRFYPAWPWIHQFCNRCVLEAFVGINHGIITRAAGRALDLLTGSAGLRVKAEVHSALSDLETAVLMKDAEHLQDVRERVMAAVEKIVSLDDSDLVDLSRATASYASDEAMIRTLLANHEQETEIAIASLIREQTRLNALRQAQQLDKDHIWVAAGAVVVASAIAGTGATIESTIGDEDEGLEDVAVCETIAIVIACLLIVPVLLLAIALCVYGSLANLRARVKRLKSRSEHH